MDRGQIKRRMHGKRKGNCICYVDLFQSREAMRDIVLLGIQEGEYCHHVL